MKNQSIIHHSHKVGEEFIKAINNVSIPCGVWIRFRKIARTYFPFPLGDYRIMRVEGEEFNIEFDPLTYIYINGTEKIPVNGETTLRDLQPFFMRRLPIHDEPILDHNGFKIMKLKEGKYSPALACFAGSAYSKKEVFNAPSLHKVIGVSISEEDINLELETEAPRETRKKKKDNSFNAFDENFSLEDYYANLNDIAIPSNNGAKSNRKKKKNMKHED
jgi:hypothetical protein